MVSKAIVEQLELVLIELEYAEADLLARCGDGAPQSDFEMRFLRLRRANSAVQTAIAALAGASGTARAPSPPQG